MWLIMPVYVGAVADSLQLTESQVGLVAAAELAAVALASVLAPFWIRRLNWRQVLFVSLPCMLLGNLASTLAADVLPLITIRLFTDFFGGCAISIGLACLADTSKTDRNFAFAIAAQTAYASAALFGLPFLVGKWGMDAIFIFLAVIILVTLPLIRFLPLGGKPQPTVPGITTGTRILPFLGLLAMLFFFANIGALWTYIERIGAGAGLDGVYIGKVLAIANIVSLAGALAAAATGDRWGHLRPLLMVLVAQVLSLGFLAGGFSAAGYLIILSIYVIFWNFAIPFQMSCTAKADHSGRLIVLATAFHGGGAAVGPGLVAVFIETGTYTAVYSVAMVCGLVSFLLFLPLFLTQQRSSS